ncbi:hypothetical protein C8Q74DRAFT_689551 [Fomes fomentarius]|nr:hypothetical protein C8Q74DRAFT_689551 [Fomes fomentarius]
MLAVGTDNNLLVYCQDVKYNNILVDWPRVAKAHMISLISKLLTKCESESYPPQEAEESGIPITTVKTQPFLPLILSLLRPDDHVAAERWLIQLTACLSDYGAAFPVDPTARDPQRFHGAGPALVRAPEALLWLDLTPAIDIWAVGCMIFQLITNQPLFRPDAARNPHRIHELNVILAQINECVGPLPKDMIDRCGPVTLPNTDYNRNKVRANH